MLQIITQTQKVDSRFAPALQARLQAALDEMQNFIASRPKTPESSALTHARIHLAKVALLLQKDIEVVLMSQAQMRRLNAEFMGKDYATDVLSFPLAPLEIVGDKRAPTLEVPLGSIAINLPLAQKISKQHTHSLCDELCLLFLHGLLHLLGFDHESDGGEHRALESKLLQTLALPQSLIDRTLTPSHKYMRRI